MEIVETNQEYTHKDLQVSQAACVHWSVGGFIYCCPENMTEEDKDLLAQEIRCQMGTYFVDCPLEYIKQRMVGGVRCPFHEDRIHIGHNAFRYGHIAASEGRYYPLYDNERQEAIEEYKNGAGALWIGTGPFSE